MSQSLSAALVLLILSAAASCADADGVYFDNATLTGGVETGGSLSGYADREASPDVRYLLPAPSANTLVANPPDDILFEVWQIEFATAFRDNTQRVGAFTGVSDQVWTLEFYCDFEDQDQLVDIIVTAVEVDWEPTGGITSSATAWNYGTYKVPADPAQAEYDLGSTTLLIEAHSDDPQVTETWSGVRTP